jgi:hypothetical protein
MSDVRYQKSEVRCQNPEIATRNSRLSPLASRFSLRFPSSVFRNTDGQVLLLGVVVIIALLAFMLAIPNGTHVTTQKMRAQNAADAGAFTGSVWLARALNLNANMNVGIRSMYTWMTALTTAQALAKALYSDTADASVMALGRDISLALFGNSDPVYVSSSIYPLSIQKLAETAQWLYDLQGDIAGSFPAVAQTMGSDQARRNVSGGNPLSQNPGGMVLVRTEDTIPLFVADAGGDSLMYADLMEFANSLQTIPTDDSNIGPATGVVLIDTHDFEIKAYYGDSSEWCTVRQVLKRLYKKAVVQLFQNNSTGVIDTGIQYTGPGGGGYTSYLHGDSWATWVIKCNEGGSHTPFIWRNGQPNPPYKNTLQWTLVSCQPTNNRYKRDTVWVKKHVVRKTDPAFGKWNVGQWEPGDSILPEVMPWIENGCEVDSSTAYPTDFFTGAESTRGNQGTRLHLRRLNPDRKLYAVSYVWRLGNNSAPFGLGPVIGGSLFPRSRVAPPCPMLAVARAEPYMAMVNPTDDDFYFSPSWDVRLTPLDSAGVHDITNDTAYASHNLTSFNLDELRRYVLLP